MSVDLTRRQALTTLAAVSLVGCPREPPPTSSQSPEDCSLPTGPQTAGPFYPGEPTSRVDIREDRAGVQLELDLLIVEVDSCTPIPGAEVDLWCADASGDYSGYPQFDSVGETWLRGQQLTGEDGVARFTAIVPGAYPGRAVHLHVKVRAPGRDELTTQVYLPDARVAEVLATPEYANSGAHLANEDDDFYAGDTLLQIDEDTPESVSASTRLVLG